MSDLEQARGMAEKLREIAYDLDGCRLDDRGLDCGRVADSLRKHADALRVSTLRAPVLLRSRTAVVVDWHEADRTATVRLLARHGWSARPVEFGEEALDLFEEELPAVVFFETMSDGNHLGGFDFMRELRRHSLTLPVILLTRFFSIEGAVEAMRRGADGYLRKPLEEEDLVPELRRLAGEPAHAWPELEEMEELEPPPLPGHLPGRPAA